MPIDPVASAMDALVTHLATTLGSTYTVLRGWPEHRDDYDPAAKPVVTVVAGEPTETRVSPRELASSTGTVTYKIADISVPVQLDVWCAHRARLDGALLAVGRALENGVPHTSGLWLAQSDYYGRPVTFEVTGGPRRHDGPDSATVGEWRATFSLRCSAARVAHRTWPEAEVITPSLELGPTVST
jgi:hypothetical protein